MRRLKEILSLSFRSSKGSTSVIIICTTLIVILLSAFLADIGYGAVERFKLKRAAEQAAVLGAEELIKNGNNIEKTITRNIVKSESGLSKLEIKTSSDNKEITVNISKPFEYIFLKFFGINGKVLDDAVTARISVINSYKGVRPFAVEEQLFNYDKTYILTDVPSNPKNEIKFYPINFKEENKVDIIYGYRKLLSVGESIDELTEYNSREMVQSVYKLMDKCKHMPKCTYQNYSKDCSRIIVIPVIRKPILQNSKKLSISGFACFFIENVNMENNKIKLSGKFIKQIVKSSTSDSVTDYGLLGIKLNS